MKYGYIASKLIIVVLFLVSLYDKIFEFDHNVEITASLGVPFATFAIIMAIIFELFGSLLFIFGGRKYTGFGAIFLLVFMVVITPIFFPFWNDISKLNSFLLNLSISGGLLYIIVDHYSDMKSLFVKKY